VDYHLCMTERAQDPYVLSSSCLSRLSISRKSGSSTTGVSSSVLSTCACRIQVPVEGV
jgi:hypothetical protein